MTEPISDDARTARETVARWMIDHAFATGHGDTLADLLAELAGQVREIRQRLAAADALEKDISE